MNFKSSILTLPGIGGSGPDHWQSIWEKEYNFTRVEQQDWDTPLCDEWVEALNSAVNKFDPSRVILVAHSAACAMLLHWVQKYNITEIKGALLVAPADPDADTFPAGASGFAPVLLNKLPFRSIVVASTNDYYVTYERAVQFAEAWGSELVNIGEAGHVNVSSGFGEWPFGLELLNKLNN